MSKNASQVSPPAAAITTSASRTRTTLPICFFVSRGPDLTADRRDMLGCGQIGRRILSARGVRFNDGAGRLRRHSAMSTPQLHVPRTLVLVGLMGARKTHIGPRPPPPPPPGLLR